MERRQTRCRNCASRRRLIKAKGLCGQCYYWEQKIQKCSAKLELLRTRSVDIEKNSPVLLTFRIRVAQRVLEEFRWREAGFLADKIGVKRLESLVRMIARGCRSKVAPNVGTHIKQMLPKSRRQAYEVLLPIIENLPVRKPLLHDGSWPEWQSKHTLSKDFGDDVRLSRALEQAYGKDL